MKVKAPAPTPEDPAVKAARDREQARADAAFITNTQGLLDDETRKRARRFGRRVALTGAGPSGAGAVGGGSATIPLMSNGAGGFGGFSGGSISDSIRINQA